MTPPFVFLVVVLSTLLLCENGVVYGNMNGNVGQYKIANGNTLTNKEFSTDYDEGTVEYFDVYSDLIKTRYSEVYWTVHGPIPLPDEIVKRFDGKTMAVVGYEVDQVIKGTNGEDVPLPITFAYNHHYVSWLLNSKKVELVKNEEIDSDGHAMFHHGEEWITRSIENDGDEDSSEDASDIPNNQFFSEGNGGEFRLSYHGYPKGYAQLIQSPDTFRVGPMHIDTWNRDEMNIENGKIDFKPGPLPKTSGIPASAGYSGLIECPCSDRLKKEWSMQYVLSSSGTCDDDDSIVQNSTECFTGAKTIVISNKYNEQSTKDDTSKPYGCSIETHSDGTTDITWNAKSTSSVAEEEITLSSRDTLTTATQVVASATVKDVSVIVTLNTEQDSEDAATITISGPADKWMGVGFGSNNMCMHLVADECPDGGPYTIIVTADDDDNNKLVVVERKLDQHGPGTVLDENSLTVRRHEISVDDDGTRHRLVVLTRALRGMTNKHYTFTPNKASTIPIIVAQGCSTTFAQHCGHGPATLNLLAVDSVKSVCRDGISGTIGGTPFRNKGRCAPQPKGDLLVQKNPTCFIETYRGGLKCCHHGQSLLDEDQEIPWPDQYLEFYFKFRFYFQEYQEDTREEETELVTTTTSELSSSTTTASKPSHQNLMRVGIVTEANVGEYDVPQCNPGVTPSQCIHVISSRTKVSDMSIEWKAPGGRDRNDPNLQGIKLIYAGPHCHAPSCISMELYNYDTGKLLCRSEPIFGTGSNNDGDGDDDEKKDFSSTTPYNENKFVAIPPCLWGSAEEGLVEPELLSMNTTLLSIKRNNNTLGHTGEMALWQMRAIPVFSDSDSNIANGNNGNEGMINNNDEKKNDNPVITSQTSTTTSTKKEVRRNQLLRRGSGSGAKK